MRTEKQIFIGGSGRSGTTILKKVIGQHQSIYTLPVEARFITDPDGLLDLIDALSSKWSPFTGDLALYRFEQLMKKYLLSSRSKRFLYNFDVRRLVRLMRPGLLKRTFIPKIRYYGRDFTAIGWDRQHYLENVDNFIEGLHHGIFTGRWMGAENGQNGMFNTHPVALSDMHKFCADFVDELLGYEAQRQSKKYWCEDTPFNALYAHRLYDMFPNMKMIYIHRDPRDVASSLLRQQWASRHPDETAIFLRSFLMQWRHVKSRLQAKCYIETKLEDLVANPMSEVERICEFIGVECEERMFNLDLSRHNIGRWQTDLTPNEVPQVMNRLGDFVLEGGFD